MARFTDLPPEIMQRIAALSAKGIERIAESRLTHQVLTLRLVSKRFSGCILEAILRAVSCSFSSEYTAKRMQGLVLFIDRLKCGHLIRVLDLYMCASKDVVPLCEDIMGRLLASLSELMKLRIDSPLPARWSHILTNTSFSNLRQADIRAPDPLLIVYALCTEGAVLDELTIRYEENRDEVSVEEWSQIDLSSVNKFTLYNATYPTSLAALEHMIISPKYLHLGCTPQHKAGVKRLLSRLEHPHFGIHLQCITLDILSESRIGRGEIMQFCVERRLSLGVTLGGGPSETKWRLLAGQKP